MISSPRWNIGVCSWSLGNDLESLSRLKKETGISTIHLHIRPELGQRNLDFIDQILYQGWHISCGMVSFEQEDYSSLETIKETGGIVPAANWPENQIKVCKAVDVLSEFGVPYLSFHFGFLDINNNDLIERVKILADYADSRNVKLLMETGQETADELVCFLQKINHQALGVNFDPANMILYGKGDPAKSIDKLKGWVNHVHLKDALGSPQAGQWGSEVPWGDGKVNSTAFLKQLVEIKYNGALCVEREQGVNRYADVVSAISKVKHFLGQ